MSNNRRISLVRPSQLFDSFVDEFFNTTGITTIGAATAQINMSEDQDNLYVDVRAGGIKPEDVNVNIEDNMLTVTGEVKEEKEEENKKKKYYMKEIREESFTRTVALPTKVDADKAEAKVEGGMIKITLPKLPEVKPKKIAIKAE